MNRHVKQVLGLTVFAAGCVALGMGLSHGWVAQAQEARPVTVEPRQVGMLPPIADVAEKLNPTVVAITNKSFVRTRRGNSSPFGDGMFDFFFGPQNPQQRRGQRDEEEMRDVSFGSGVLVSSDGEILTNRHVIENQRGGNVDKLEVRLSDGRTFEATVLGKDDGVDIALIKIDAKNLAFAQLGDSDKARVGDWVVAIGNPLGLEHTVTQGIISAKGRSARSVGANSQLETYLQTDAAINRGNSGGPLLNLRGEILGINTAMNPMGQNIGFAVPSNLVRRILPDLRAGRPVSRGFLGVSLEDLDEAFQDALGTKEGVLVSEVTEGQAAAKAGVKKLDVLVAVDGTKVNSREDVIGLVASRRAGDKVELALVRQGKPMTLSVVLGDRRTGMQSAESPTGDNPKETPGASTFDLKKDYGFEVGNLTAQLRGQFGLPDSAQGVVVTDVVVRSEAGDKLQEGLLITAVGRTEVKNVEDLKRAVQAARGKAIILQVTFYSRNTEINRMVSIPPRK